MALAFIGFGGVGSASSPLQRFDLAVLAIPCGKRILKKGREFQISPSSLWVITKNFLKGVL
jgi:hypothetical protein